MYAHQQAVFRFSGDRAALRATTRALAASCFRPSGAQQPAPVHVAQRAQPRRGPARARREVGQIRGVLATRVEVSTELDPFLSLRALAAYSSVSIRKLHDLLDDLAHPLPHYRIGGKIVVRRSEYDAWVAVHRRRSRLDVDRIVDDLLRDLRP